MAQNHPSYDPQYTTVESREAGELSVAIIAARAGLDRARAAQAKARAAVSAAEQQHKRNDNGSTRDTLSQARCALGAATDLVEDLRSALAKVKAEAL